MPPQILHLPQMQKLPRFSDGSQIKNSPTDKPRAFAASRPTNRLNITTLTSGCLFNFQAALIQNINHGLNEREDANSICEAAMKLITFVFSDRVARRVSRLDGRR